MLHSFFQEGKIVCLSPLEEEDIEMIRIWRNRDDIRCRFINQDIISEQSQRKWFEGYISKPGDYVFIISDRQNRRKIGMCALYNLDENKKCAEFGRFIIADKESHGKGYGKDALLCAEKIAFKHMGLEKLRLEVFSDNIPAVRVYEKCGFKRKGENCLSGKLMTEMEICAHEYDPEGAYDNVTSPDITGD